MSQVDARSVLIVVPALNEERSIAAVVQAIRETGFDLVVVSDGSTDKTVEECRRVNARVLQLPINLGVGGALRTGFRYAVMNGFDAVVQVDADGQHTPTDIASLIEAANSGHYDMVIGSRFSSSRTTMTIGRIRRAVMKLLAQSATTAARSNITDPTSGFRLIRGPLLRNLSQSLASNYLGDTYEAVISSGRAGYSIGEIATEMRNRAHGDSTATLGDSVKFTLKAFGVYVLRLHTKLSASV